MKNHREYSASTILGKLSGGLSSARRRSGGEGARGRLGSACQAGGAVMAGAGAGVGLRRLGCRQVPVALLQ